MCKIPYIGGGGITQKRKHKMSAMCSCLGLHLLCTDIYPSLIAGNCVLWISGFPNRILSVSLFCTIISDSSFAIGEANQIQVAEPSDQTANSRTIGAVAFG